MFLLCSEVWRLAFFGQTELSERSQRDLKAMHARLSFSNRSLFKLTNSSPGKYLIPEIKHSVWRLKGKM